MQLIYNMNKYFRRRKKEKKRRISKGKDQIYILLDNFFEMYYYNEYHIQI